MEKFRRLRVFPLRVYVRTVRIWSVCPTVLIARAHVNLSQKSSEKPHDAWIGLQSNGEILAAHCTCMAGKAPSL